MTDPRELQALAEDLLAVAEESAVRAGRLLLEGMGRRRSSVTSKSSATDMVTDVDRASEALIVSIIDARRPGDSVLGEEGGERAGTTGVRWVIDPLDGTTNYLYGFPTFAVSVAAEIGARAVAAAVHDPARRETFTALRGRGAWCNGTPIRVSQPADLSAALVGTGFSYEAARRADQARILTAVLPSVRDIRRAGAAALDLCWVGMGRLDAFFESGLQPWDRAAGELVAAEAGAIVSDMEDRPPPRRITVAAAPSIDVPLRQLLADARRGARLPAPGGRTR